MQSCSSNLKNTTAEDLCIFARKQLSIHNLCKTDDSVKDAFSGMGSSVTDTLVTALTKLRTSQEAKDNRLNEMSKKFEERNTNLTNQFNDFFSEKSNTTATEGLFFAKPCSKLKFFHS